MCRLLPPVALLLLTSAGTRAADLPKAVVSLDPKWDRLLEKDNVTLQCRGAHPKEDNSTQWFHNGKPLPGQSSTYVIADARVKDSGNYSCQTASFTLSDPVQLNVYADLPKAVVSLDPKWDRLLEKDNVTLQCRGAHPKEDNSTRWFHNGKPLPGQSSTYVIADARVKDSGNYSCQTASFTLSDAVQLNVYAGWLVLQAARWVLQEGEPLQLRCHSWKNVRVAKVQYFRNGRGQQFSHKNSEFHIQHTERAHSGSYFCRAIIGKQNVSSEAVNVTVQGLAVPAVSPFFLLWQMAFCLVMGLLFAVDTKLYFSVQKELRSSLRKKGNDKVTWSKSP